MELVFRAILDGECEGSTFGRALSDVEASPKDLIKGGSKTG